MLLDQYIHYRNAKQINARDMRDNIFVLLGVTTTIRDIEEALTRFGYVKQPPVQIKQRVGYITRVYWRNDAMMLEEPTERAADVYSQRDYPVTIHNGIIYRGVNPVAEHKPIHHTELFLWLVFNNAPALKVSTIMKEFPEFKSTRSVTTAVKDMGFEVVRYKEWHYTSGGAVKLTRRTAVLTRTDEKFDRMAQSEDSLGKDYLNVQSFYRPTYRMPPPPPPAAAPLQLVDIEEHLCHDDGDDYFGDLE